MKKNISVTISKLAFVLLFMLFADTAVAKIIKVDASVPTTATQNGIDWITAFKTLQQALDVAEAGDDIWLAGGTYYPTKAANIFDERTKAFWTFGGIKLYGGFNQSTNNFSFATRDPQQFPVILSGEIQQDGNAANNAYCVLKTYVNNGFAVLDGITVTGAYDINGYGGGVYLNSVSPIINNCTFTGNFAFQGAGIFCDNIIGASSPTITNCRFTNNSTGTVATGTPAGAAIYAKGGNLQISNCIFTGNNARVGSAIVMAGGGNPAISGSTFTGNITTFPDQNSCVIYSFGNNCSITTTVIANNGARGVMLQNASGSINTCTMNNNNGGGAFLLNSNTTIANCYFQNNTNAYLSSVLGTMGDGKGGGLHISGAVAGTPALVYNCLFSGNRATEGGGLYIQSNSANSAHKGPRIVNCTVTDNSLINLNGGLPYRGGGVYCQGDASSFLFFSASYGYDFNTKFQNCIIWGNKGTGGNNFDNYHFRPTVNPSSGLQTFWAKPFYENCLLGAGTPEIGTFTSTDGGVNYNGTCIQNANPLFENPAAGNYALSFCSRAINAGNNNLFPQFVTGDLEGQPRFFNGVIDMGCFEKQSPPEGKRVFLPPVNVCEGGSALIWGQLRTVSGTYDTVLVASNGCDSVRSVVFTVRPKPLANVSFADNCNATGTINITPIVGTASFNVNLNGNNQVVSAGATASYPGLSAGNYPYTITDAFGCVTNSSATLTTYNIPQSRLFVDLNATGTGNGLSWANAFTNFQSALDLAACSNINEIWVAEGVYVPSKDPAGNITATPSATFRMYNNVAIYGGFSIANGAIDLSTRNPKLYRTILSGDIQQDGNPGNNAYNVINNFGLNLNNSAVLDGFVISGAWNNASAQGGGIINYLSSPTFRNCEISNNFAGGLNNARGGGMCNIQCAPVVENCTFLNNLASGITDAYGGAIANLQSGATLKNCVFKGNNCSAPNTVGGGIYIANAPSATVIDNCLFAENAQGAFCADGSANISINNTTIAGNSGNVSAPGGLYLINTSPLISNTIVWGNTNGNVLNVSATPTFFYCLVQGSGAPGSWNGAFGINAGANIDVNPLFENDYELSICSPAKDAGNPAAYGGPTAPTDLNGNSRIVGIGLDMGCFEFQSTPTFSGTVYVNHAAIGNNDGSNWANAFTSLQAALDRAKCFPITEIWVSEGTYYPTRTGDGNLTNSPFATFRMKNGLSIYGGFSAANGITTFAARNPKLYETVLSGELQQDGIASNNAYNVINNYQNGLDNSAVLDGFTISDAFNSYDISGGSGNTIGGGIINVNSSPKFANCIIKNNVVQAINNGYGAGMYNANSNPIVENCVFENNAVSASFIAYGGGIANINSGISLKRTSIERNTTSAPNRVGGGFYGSGFSGETDMDNCLFAGNNDGGICVDGTNNMTINNSTIADNQGNPASAGGLYSINCSPFVSNSIIYGNTFGNVENFSASPSFFYCLVGGSGAPGSWNTAYGINFGANKDENPRFASGYRLNACSPAIDAGNPAAYSKPISTADLSGGARILNGVLDMGCFEYTGVNISAYGNIAYVDEFATGANNGLNWTDAFTDFQSALNIAACGAVTEIWVSKGTYTPTVDPNGITTTSPFATFRMQNNLAIYGGFSVVDGITTFGSRNWKLYPAVLSGDIQRDGNPGNNAYNVINNYNNALNASAILDGFTIVGAWNNITGVGGGIINYLSSPTFKNCNITSNFAGGVNNARGAGACNIQCSPTYINCNFNFNNASGIVDAYGAGMCNQFAGVKLNHCDFQYNDCNAPNVVGGGFYSFGSTLPTEIDNCLFANNNFGGICIDGSADVTINNSTLTANTGNTTSLSGGLYFLNCSPFVSNSIVAANNNGNVHNINANPSFFYCLVEGSGAPSNWINSYGINFGANLDANPRLDATYKPYPCSPVVNAGNPAAYSKPIAPFDLNGAPRIQNGVLDMGCFEANTDVVRRLLAASICQGQTYTLGSSSFTTTGNYTVTLPGIAIGGCDSIVDLSLMVKQNTTSTTNLTICQNQLPFVWNGLTFVNSGTQSTTLVNANGCDSIATLNLTVNPNTSSTTNLTICQNQLPFSWNGLTFTNSGTQSTTLTNANGCDSIATLNLAVNPNTSSSTNLIICQNQLPFSWNGLTFTNSGTQSATLTNANGCDSIATLNLAVNPNTSSTTNLTICQNQLPFSWNGLTFTNAGTQSTTLVNANGCDSIATLNLAVNPNTSSTTNLTICQNQLPFSWNGLTFTNAGTQSTTLTNANGCDSIATLNLVVNPNTSSTTNITICQSQLPFSWNGLTFTNSGSQSATLVNANGCDSIATLNLTVNPNTSSTTNLTICQNQLPFSWNGLTFTNAGTQSTTLTNANGCDSIATLNLAVNPNTSSTTNLTICQNQLPFVWNGLTFTNAGTKSTTLVNANGCDSIATLNLSVNPNTSSTTNLTICQNQLPFSWNGLTFTNAGTQSTTLTNANGCDSIATLNLVVNPNTSSTTNITICQSQLPFSWNGLTFTNSGSQSATLVNVNGCDSIATLNLAVNPNTSSTTNLTICQNQLPFVWNGLTFTNSGSQSATLVNANGCDSIATLNLAVNPNTSSTTNLTICQSQLPFSWNGLTFTNAGTQSATLVNANGCDSIATLNLTVNPNTSSTTNLTICQNQLPFSWNGLTFTNAGTQSTTLTNANGCDSIATLNLAVNPNTSSTTNLTICQNQLPFSWNGLTFTNAGTQSTTLTNANGCDSIATLNLAVNPNTSSTTNLTICQNQLPFSWNGLTFTNSSTQSATLVNANGCDSIATLSLAVNPNTSSTTNLTICQNQLPFSWNGLTFTNAGTQSTTLVNANSCDSIATLNLTVNPNTSSTTNLIICQNQLPFSWNGLTFNNAGTQSATLVNANGCDSIATLNLAVNSNTSSTTNLTICQNQLPFIWNGLTFTNAGTQSATLTNANGCDSTATLNLAVNPNTNSTTNLTICQNQLPFVWNGLTFTNAGTQSATLTNANGCDSIATLNLAVNPNTSSTTNITICQSQLPFSWNGLTFTNAGTQSATLVNANGCDSIATLNLAVNPNTSSTTNLTICQNQLPFVWNGLTFTNSGSQSATLVNANGCDSIATLNLSVNPNTSSTTNLTICQNQLPFSWNGLTFTNAGTQSTTLVNANGCDSIATLSLAVNPNTSSTTNLTICQNQLPFVWNGLTFTNSGSQSATLVNANGCDSIATLNLAVNPNTSSTTNLTICQNQLPFSWNGLTFTNAGTQSATLVNANGCDSIATLNLAVNPNTSSTTNLTICQNQLPFSWNGLTFTNSGTQSATLTNANGCDSIATLNLAVNPNTSSTTNLTICQNQLPFSWNGLTFTNAGTQSTTLVNANGCDSIATLNLAVNPNTSSTTNITICQNQLPFSWNGLTFTNAGTQSTTLTNANGCDSIATLNLTVNPNTSSTTNLTICQNQLPFSWNGLTFTNAGTQSTTLTNANGCDSIATLNLAVNPNTSSTTNLTICQNQLPFSWNGLTFTNAGTQSTTLVNANGCDSIATLNLVVNPNTSSTTNLTICQNQLPFSWNGLTFTNAGTQSATLTNANGCDSIATLNLAVNPNTSSTTNITICQSQLPFSWNGLTFTNAGTQSTTLVNANSCDSIATLNLTVNPNTSSTTNLTICQNQLPFSWNGLTFTNAGTQSTTLTNANGCDSIATLNLAVNPNTSSTTNLTICQNQLPFSWNGLTFTNAGTQSATLVNTNGCDSIATLNLAVNPNTSSTTNLTICQNQLPFSWNGLTFTNAGTQSTTLTNANGCDSIATLNLTVNPNTSSTTNLTICQNQLPFSWNGLTFTNSGTQSATLTNANGCDSIATLNLAVNSNTSSTTNLTICQNQLPFSWNGLTFTNAGTQSTTLTNANGCDSIATLNLAVNPNTSSTTNLTICQNQLPFVWNGLTFTNSGSQSATLVNVNGCDSIATLNLAVNPNTSSTTNLTICQNQLPFVWNGLTFTNAGTKSTTLVNANGCDSIATLNLTVNPNTSSTTNLTICQNQLPFSWNGLTFTNAGTQSTTLTNANGCDSIATLNLAVQNFILNSVNAQICAGDVFDFNGQQLTQAGQYFDTLTSVGGCDSILTLTLTVNALPQPTITQSGNVLSTQSFSNYQWQLNGNNINGATNQNYTATQNGNYTVQVTDANGCSNTSSAVNVTGVGISEIADFRSMIYPNPTSTVLNIESDVELDAITVTDLIGREVFTQSKISNQKSKIDVSALSESTYFIHIKTSTGKSAVKSFVKQ